MNEVILTGLLVAAGFAQVYVLVTQNSQARLALMSEYRKLWNDYKPFWGNIIFIGRIQGEYYQVVSKERIEELKELTDSFNPSAPTIWARESIQKIFGFLGEVSTRILQGQLDVSDTYPIFGTEFLRHSGPLRLLLEPNYRYKYPSEFESAKHKRVRKEVQDWLIYHDGLRRRCLILIDLLWAEAVRLEDLPPEEMRSAAEAKKITGNLNRARVCNEVIQLNGYYRWFLAKRLSRFLKRAEYFSKFNWIGIKKERIAFLKTIWTSRLLRE